jgi:8-amino-7-oxononanoate synthase
MTDWERRAAERLEVVDGLGERRRIPDWDGAGNLIRLVDGRELLSFASNDYLGLSQHPKVIADAQGALDEWGAGSGSARLIVGARAVHRDLESELADWKSKESALLFPSGYMANVGVLSAFGEVGTTIFSDELNHASIVDGCRLARSETVVYPHLDLEELEKRLSRVDQAIVVSDTVFSMDGDVADVDGLTEICARHGALLVLDEAHAVLGPDPQASSKVDRIRIGTLSKFLGSAGGFVASDQVFTDTIVNTARSFIFTTAGTPADAAAALAALQIFRGQEGERLKADLRERIDLIAPGHPSPIIPVVVGEAHDALAAATAFEKEGFLVPAIRPPSVPKGTARLRITVTATHPIEEVERFAACLAVLQEQAAGA